MGFATQTAAANQLELEKIFSAFVRKVTPTLATNSWQSTFLAATGSVGAGSAPTAGKANGAVCTSASAGAWQLPDPPSGKEWWLYNLKQFVTTTLTSNLLVDRVAHCNIAGDEPSGAITGLDATSRLEAAGTGQDDGCQIFLETNTTFTGGNTYTADYVDSDGASKTTPVFTTASPTVVGQSALTSGLLWVPLAAGSRGVRSVSAITKTGGAATGGTINICLVRPIRWFPTVSVGSFQAERDLIAINVGLRRIFNSSCLQAICGAPSTTAATLNFELGLVHT